MEFYRDTYVEVDLTKLEHNIARIREVNKKQLIGVIKANAYGHGATHVAKKLVSLGCAMLAVSSLDEAMELRYDGVEAPILIVGYIRPSDAEIAANHNISVAAVSLKWCEELPMTEHTLHVHLATDTAMNRIGMKTCEELKKCVAVLKSKNVDFEGIFTHYAMSDVADNALTNKQYAKFKELVESVKDECNFKYIHSSNSDATMHYEEDITNAVRVGLVMYGYSTYDKGVQPVLSYYTKLTCVKKVLKGERIGYSQTYELKEDAWVGTIPIGYADGWIRANQGRYCFIGDEKCEFVGRVCMDQAMILLPHEFPVDSTVELIGEHISAEDIAKDLGTISYEVMCLISDRVPRVYIEDDKRIGIVNPRMPKDRN